MKHLYLIGGTMGVGKTTVSQQLKLELSSSVFLDGDWCWDANPFKVTEETKNMVMNNISYLLLQFIHCSEYDNIIFCWVMHQQEIIDDILNRIREQDNIAMQKMIVKNISLIANENCIRDRLTKDVMDGKRDSDVIERSIRRIPLYEKLNTIKIDTSDKSVEEIVKAIIAV